MSNQIDGRLVARRSAWQIDDGKIRVIATGNDASVFKGQTVRTLITTQQVLQSKKSAMERYMMKGPIARSSRGCTARSRGAQGLCRFRRISVAMAKRTRDDFFPKGAIDPDRLVGLT